MTVPQRFKLRLTSAYDLFVPEDYKAAAGDVVPFQGLGLLLKQTPHKNTRGVEVVTLHVQTTEITLLGHEDAERWVAVPDVSATLLAAVARRGASPDPASALAHPRPHPAFDLAGRTPDAATTTPVRS